MTQNNVQLQNGNGPLAGLRNQIINGGFDFWQRGEPVEFSGVGYGADRWGKVNQGALVAVAFNRTTAHGFSGLTHACNFTTSTDLGGVRIRQPIELYRQGYAGQFVGQWTLSWYSSAVPDFATVIFSNGLDNATPGASWTEDGVGIQSLGSNRYSLTFTASGTVQPTDKCVLVSFKPPAGSTSWTLSGVQLEPGPVATPFEHRPIGTEFALCQRYYTRLDGAGGAAPTFVPAAIRVTATSTANGGVTVPAPMRTIPTLGISSVSDFQVSSGGGTPVVPSSIAITPAQSRPDFLVLNIAVSGSLPADQFGATSGIPYRVEGNNSGAYMEFDAEL